MNEQIILAGFGGQGVMAAGQLLAYAGMIAGKNVSWLPSYGPEMRGGTANCGVILSDEPVGSPIVTQATGVIALNRPSLDKFEDYVLPGGKLFINSALIERKSLREDILVYYIPANDIAEDIGHSRVANMVMLGACVAGLTDVTIEVVSEALKKVMGGGKAEWIPINEEALRRGVACIR